ncbi:MAG TPA: cellulase N-terminal Ig-like domain-containing protein, partial [Pyrinomonadaceae bacterium]
MNASRTARLRIFLPIFLTVSLLGSTPTQSKTSPSTTSHVVQQIYLRVNQVGYPSRGSKIAIAMARESLPPTFEIVNLTTSQIVFTGNLKPVTGSWGEFRHHAQIDFSALQKEGRYFVRLVAMPA